LSAFINLALQRPYAATFQWIGQRVRRRNGLISKHTCDWHYAQVIEIEVYIWQKYTTVAGLRPGGAPL